MVMKYLRRNVKIFMLALVVAFVVWEIGTATILRKTSALKYAGTMYGKYVTLQDFQKAYHAVWNRALMQYGDKVREKTQFSALRDEAWDRLLLLSEARRLRIRVSDREVIDEIARYPFFQRDGAFDTASYEYVLRHIFGTTPHDFEEETRDSLKIRKLFSARKKALMLSEDKIKELYDKENTSFTIDAVVFPFKQYAQAISPTESQLKTYYEANKERYSTGPRLDFEYVAVPYSDFYGTITVSEAEINEYYASHKKDLGKDVSPQERQADTPDETTRNAIKNQLLQQKAQAFVGDMLQQIYTASISDITFDEAVRKAGLSLKRVEGFTKDKPLSVIGYSYNFLQSVFSLKPGELSNPIIDQKAAYLVKLRDAKKATIKPLKDVEALVKQTIVDEEAKKLAQSAAQDLLKKTTGVATHEDFIAQVSADRKDHKSYGPFRYKEYISEIGPASKIVDQVYASSQGAVVPRAIESEAGYLVAYLAVKNVPDEKTFEKEKDTFANNALAQRVYEDYMSYYAALKQKARIKNFITGSPRTQ
jgi:peptidyl-prolyl cis-trans isomerase D